MSAAIPVSLCRLAAGLCLLAACAPKPASIEVQGELPSRIWDNVPVELPPIRVLTAEGKEIEGGFELTVRTNPSFLATFDRGRLSAAVHGKGELIVEVAGTAAKRTVPIEVMVPDGVDVTCARSCDVFAKKELRLSAKVRRGAEVLEGAPITWSSSSDTVLVSRGGGVFHAVAAGPATVRATIGAVFGTTAVRVSADKIDEIKLTCPPNGHQAEGANGACVVKRDLRRALAVDLRGDRQPVYGVPLEWTLSDPSVASIIEDQVVGRKIGKTKITVKAGGVSAHLDVEVWPAPCGEKIAGYLSWVVARNVTYSLGCRAPDPETCLDFYWARTRDSDHAVSECCCTHGYR